MEDLHNIFDSLVGFLIGMTLIEVVVKPILVRTGKAALERVDDHVSWVPDWLYEEKTTD